VGPVTAKRRTSFATVDLDKPGKQSGFVMIPHSPHDDAWGVTRVPIAVISNGKGPTVLIEGGNHGDEYEGPITICELIRKLDPVEIQGRLILMPAVNVHAVSSGTRTSPIDGLNFNRTFPGDAYGSITQQISDFVAHEIFPRCDAFLDLHSGGSSLDILPSTIIEPTEDAELHRRNVAAVRAFDAPLIVMVSNYGDQRTATAAACQAGLTTVGTEMGGGGTVKLEALAICRRGVRNVLAHLGVLEADASAAKPRGDSRLFELPGSRAFV
jgi:N-alpha-acetyl-L-2,4-diaminobutyrate deacetylase